MKERGNPCVTPGTWNPEPGTWNLLKALEGFLNFPQGIAQHDGAAVRAGHGTFGKAQLLEEPFHLAPLERHIDLDGSVAGDGGGDPRAQLVERDGPGFRSHAIQDF